jgi:uncharacterized protein YjbI with pentapeptide repeats
MLVEHRMSGVLEIAASIKTPMALAALAILVLFLLYRVIFSRLRLEKVASKEVAALVSEAMTLLFWLASAALIATALAYVALAVFDKSDEQVTDGTSRLHPGAESSLAAVQTLSRIAARSERYDDTICVALSAYVRDSAPYVPEDMFMKNVRADLQSAVALLSDLNRHDRCGRIDLNGADLRRVNLSKGSLRGASLVGVQLTDADLAGADLTGADLTGANLNRTVLQGAIAVGANFTGAEFEETDLGCATLDRARGFAGTDLRSSNLAGTSFVGVDLGTVKMIDQSSGADCPDKEGHA